MASPQLPLEVLCHTTGEVCHVLADCQRAGGPAMAQVPALLQHRPCVQAVLVW